MAKFDDQAIISLPNDDAEVGDDDIRTHCGLAAQFAACTHIWAEFSLFIWPWGHSNIKDIKSALAGKW